MTEMRRFKIDRTCVLAESFDDLQYARDTFTVVGNPTMVNSPYGKAMNFETGDYITLSGYEELLRFDGTTQDFSIVAQLSRTRYTTINTILDKRDGGGDGYTFRILANDTVTFALGSKTAISNGTITDDDYYTLAAVADRNGNAQIYINGSPDGSIALASEALATTVIPRVSSNAFNVGNGLNGPLASLLVYRRRLSETEIDNIHKGKAF